MGHDGLLRLTGFTIYYLFAGVQVGDRAEIAKGLSRQRPNGTTENSPPKAPRDIESAESGRPDKLLNTV
jgi:hypothetical protein